MNKLVVKIVIHMVIIGGLTLLEAIEEASQKTGIPVHIIKKMLPESMKNYD